jgi:hypothetical protein
MKAIWIFFGWKWIVVLVWGYVCCLIGANSPQTFKRSKAGLERIAQNAAAKAKALALKGKE